MRRINADGTLDTVAGNGESATLRTDGPDATELAFNAPAHIAFGPDGLLYVFDLDVVRRINSDGSVTAVAGSYDPVPFVGDVDGSVATSVNLGIATSSFHAGQDSDYPSFAWDPTGLLHVAGFGFLHRVEANGTITRLHTDATADPFPDDSYVPVPFDDKYVGRFAGIDFDSAGRLWFAARHPYGHVAYAEDGIVYTANSSVGNAAQPTIVGNDIYLVGIGFIRLFINQPPIAVDDSARTVSGEDTQVYVLDNDTDPDNNLRNEDGVINGSSITPSDPPHGQAYSVGGTHPYVLYRPDTGFVGTDGFSYEVCDTEGLCDTATITVTVTPPPDSVPPTLGTPVWSQNPVSAGSATIVTVPATDDNSGVVGGEYFIGDADPGIGAATPASWDGTNLFASIGPVSDGVYAVTFRAFDAAGNVSDNVVDYLVVFSQTTLKVTGRKDVQPTPADQDVLPGIEVAEPGETARFGFTVQFDGDGVPKANSGFSLSFATGSKCNSPHPVNCHDFSVDSSSINWLVISGEGDSVATFAGNADVVADGVATTGQFLVQAQDGDRLGIPSADLFAVSIWEAGLSVWSDPPTWLVHLKAIDSGDIKIR